MSETYRNGRNAEPIFHPVSHYESPDDVLGDARLSTDEKRVILSSWASDMYVVESHPALREVPGVPHRLRLDDILAALKQLDDDDPPPRGGSSMRLTGFSELDCGEPGEPPRFVDRHPAVMRDRLMRTPKRSRWNRAANVRRYRKLLNTRLTDIERNFIERRLAEELRG